MDTKGSAVSVFEYMDYRAFLRDYYRMRKAQEHGFSYRAFSRRAQLKSPSYLKMVFDGERNLSPEMAARFAVACGLDAEGSAYFQDLVAFNQASTSAERNARYRNLTGFRAFRKAHRLELAQAAYHSGWYVPAIRELVTRSDFREDPAWIGSTLLPPVAEASVRQALRALLELGLLVRDEQGRLRQADPVVSTGPETRGLHIGNYHRSMMERAAAAIDLVPAASRDISSLTLNMSSEGLRRIKTRLQRFREELVELSLTEDDPEQVVQINFQLFPLSRARDGESG